MKATKKLFIGVMAVAIAATVAYAAVLQNEPFAYPDGPLDGQGAWTAHSSAGNKPQQVISGQARYEESPQSGEDLNTAFAPQDSLATTYACFEFNIPSAGPLGPANVGSAPVYVAHFKDPNSTFFFMARVWVMPDPTGGAGYGLGLTSTSGTVANIVPWAGTFAFDQTYKIATAYIGATGESKMWVNPADQNDTSISQTGFDKDVAGQFALRQSSPSGLGAAYYVVVDNLKIAQAFHEACDTPVQVDQTTWGKVKGTYR
jgi:hypothetical protein